MKRPEKPAGLSAGAGRRVQRWRAVLLAPLAWISGAGADEGAAVREPIPEISAYTADMTRSDGFVDFYFDPAGARVLLEIAAFDQDLLYLTALPHGVGSNDIGLDRGQLRRTRVVRFQRSGNKVLLNEQNLEFRASSDNPAEVAAVEQSFARSTLAGFEAVARRGEILLIDATSLLLGDAHGVGARLEEREQGSYEVDPARSAPDPAALKNFPRNTVLEAWVTLKGSKPGAEVRSVVPTPEALTVKMRHQFVALPAAGFERRPYHPRAGYFPFSYRDYAAPLGQPLERRFIVRHRLRPAPGEPLDPLVYYVDRGAPEPVRSALVDGASWWADAFRAAGLEGAFRVELLPVDVDPLDLDYNVIQWVHRSTRGWSYGASVVDPRSGEILKGHVSLGSLRVRQDLLLAEGLTAPYRTGTEHAFEVRDMALARIRQLAAHEVGHTLGLAHNFAASARHDASVMDYPHPFVRLGVDGDVVLSDSYGVGIGAWDKLAVEYGYREFSTPEARKNGLAEILERAAAQNLRFVSDPDVRGIETAHAEAHLWDNGADPLARFDELMAIRARALETFSERVLVAGDPLFELERKLVPVYLLHRYQAEAVAKQLGGVDYDYGVRGDAPAAVTPVAAPRQRAALDRLIAALSPDALELAPRLLAGLEPPPFGYERDREHFSHLSGHPFDAFAPARSAAQLIASMVLEPGRAQRMIQQHALDGERPGLEEVLESLSARALIAPMNDRSEDADAVLAREVAWVVLRELQRLASAPKAGDGVRARGLIQLSAVERRLRRGPAEARVMASEIERFLDDPDPDKLPPRYPIPPGPPI